MTIAIGSGGCTANACSTTQAVAYCGDGLINQPHEVCDDGNSKAGDGCTAECDQIEVGWACTTPGQACEDITRCGDGKITGEETCDYGTAGPSQGCGADCQLRPGWACPVPGLPCQAAKCGDGILAGDEECEFTTQAPRGCSGICRIEPGYDCDSSTFTCKATVCGDTKTERGEQCDDGNDLPFDGCYQCRKEPSCSGGACVASCGDGQRFQNEACDDGNTRSGDGCSASCEVEAGFTCTDMTQDPPGALTQPIVLRDFVGANRAVGTQYIHPDFNSFGGCPKLGVVESTLGSDGHMVFACPGGDCKKNPGASCFSSGWTGTTDNFDQWYRDVDGVNLTVPYTIILKRQTDGTYKFDSDDPLTTALEPFDPLSTAGWVGLGKETQADCASRRNVSFTSELHFWFEYRGGERFDFSGDDDVWVFANARLAIDMGGLHERTDGYFVLDAKDGSAVWASADGITHMNGAPSPSAPARIDLGMVLGGVYEVVVFQAERNQCDSNFRVTLRNFSRPLSACESHCGDGIVSSTELCDDGTNDSVYNGCAPGCVLAPFCGDSIVQANQGEECDDGVNTSLYGGCAPGCKRGPSCGDGLVQARFEQCDDGINDGGYLECSPGCHYGERCGDGVIQSPMEECDNGPENGQGSCLQNCRLGTIL